MCGIFGVISKDSNFISINYLNKVLDTLHNRGPDDRKIWISDDNKIGFGHTRLAIQDLSSNASQPMFKEEKDFNIVFNGEIYNHNIIRNNINKHSNIEWVSTSDTETILISFMN